MPAEKNPQTLHIVSHTHWDREWYRSFQQFRLKLVHLIDNLLTILDNDPDYLFYMLDGQTIVLEDYLQMRMANLPRLQKYIHDKRVLIGPWYILPDEFLVSPEATIRNLLIGKEICALFNSRMMVGYIPDPFGHIAQLPQILRGFHMDTACLWRGVPDGAPLLLNWKAPDGSMVLLAHLYSGYGDIADWPKVDLDESVRSLDKVVDRLEPYNPSSQFLLLRGTDHFEPRAGTPAAIAYYNQKRSAERLALHSTLPAYLAAATRELGEGLEELPVIRGELRDPQKAHLLPAVLSARMWIKQRNWYSQNLLERWAEPFSTWAELVNRGQDAFTPIKELALDERLNDPGPIIHQAWKLLITNHPHDSICGCSIDETHRDMVSRFDQVDQIGEAIKEQSLKSLLQKIDTCTNAPKGAYAAVTVFNASPVVQNELVSLEVEVPSGKQAILVDHNGAQIAALFGSAQREFKEGNTFTFSDLGELLASVSTEEHNSMRLIEAKLVEEDDLPTIEAVFSNIMPPDDESLATVMMQLTELSGRLKPEDRLRAKVFSGPKANLKFNAQDLPAMGYKTYYLLSSEQANTAEERETHATFIENDWFRLELAGENGSLNLLDKRKQISYQEINQFLDCGDRGDEYNFTPPEEDFCVEPELRYMETYDSPLDSRMVLHCVMKLPLGLTEDRRGRLDETIECPLELEITLSKAIPVIDFLVRFENQALDHRLEVRFPTGLVLDKARFDSHFYVCERAIDLPISDSNWMELPRPESPQRDFADLSNHQNGLMLANQGLPEAAALRDEEGRAVLSLTLLRCVGWLSRDDLWNRKGHAGPPIATPEAQELGVHAFSYRLIPHLGDWEAAAQLARSFQLAPEAFQGEIQTGTLPDSSAIVHIEPRDFIITAIKEAEDESGTILRGYNQSDSTIELKIDFNLPYKNVFLANMDESFIEEINPDVNGNLSLSLEAHKVLTLLFKLEDLD